MEIIELRDSNRTRDEIFPICVAQLIGDRYVLQEILGTAFFIGNEGYCLTAAHVVEKKDNLCAALIHNNNWIVQSLSLVAVHPDEDIALLKCLLHRQSRCKINPQVIPTASHQYISFGYPIDNYFENIQDQVAGRVLPNPDLICTIGYIRRRLNMQLPTIKGSNLIEISELAGKGCSGSPIFLKGLELAGIYIGEKISTDYAVAYAVRVDAFARWRPEAIKKRLYELTEVSI